MLRHGHPIGVDISHVLEAARADDSIPKELASVISRKFRFVVSISNKIYQNDQNGLSFQVHRIDAPAGKQAQSSVCYRASSSASGSGLKSSSSDIVLSKGGSQDLKSYETLSPEVWANVFFLIYSIDDLLLH
jgi:hypothetical protein